MRFGANIALRLAYMCPDKIKAVAVIGPIVHSLLHEEKYQQDIPRMVLMYSPVVWVFIKLMVLLYVMN